jgi:predicted nucleic-acid-binding protein
MSAVDTNVLVRYIVRDDALQLQSVVRLMERSIARGEPMFVPVTVLLELEWVLRTRFKFSKESVIEAFHTLFSANELAFESLFAVRKALRSYRTSVADLADCFHLALVNQSGECPMFTFDRQAARMDGARLLSAASLDEMDLSAWKTDAASGSYRPPRVAAPWTASPG